MTPGYEGGLATTGAIQIAMPRGGTLKNLYIVHNTTAGNGNNIVYTVRVNGVTQTLAVTLASTSSSGSDTTHSITVAAGDLVDIQITKAASIGSSPSDVMATMEFAA